VRHKPRQKFTPIYKPNHKGPFRKYIGYVKTLQTSYRLHIIRKELLGNKQGITPVFSPSFIPSFFFPVVQCRVQSDHPTLHAALSTSLVVQLHRDYFTSLPLFSIVHIITSPLALPTKQTFGFLRILNTNHMELEPVGK
jgi:hypothetical protein